ncbi:MAG: hypothetical protein D6780_05380 [Candidatus Dadabacteria bacterium]|nr:MAG: hypothetical protein D6780_05380 [Candidatus Dadabacteria bacterium]
MSISYGGRYDRVPTFNCVPAINQFRSEAARSPINKELLSRIDLVFSEWKNLLDIRFGEQNYRAEYLNRIQVVLPLKEESGVQRLTTVTFDRHNKGAPTKGEYSLTFDDVETVLIKHIDGNVCWVNPYKNPGSKNIPRFTQAIVENILRILSDSKRGIIKESEGVLYPARSSITTDRFGTIAKKPIKAPIIEFFSFPERSPKNWLLLRAVFHSANRLRKIAEHRQQIEGFLTTLLTDSFMLASYWRWVIDEGVSTSKELTAGEKKRITTEVVARKLDKLTNIELLKTLASPAFINELSNELVEKKPKRWKKDLRNK